MLTILYGCYQSVAFVVTIPDDKVLEDNSIKMKTAIFLPVFGSIMLVALFFFLDWLIYLLEAFVTISGFSSTSFVVYSLIYKTVAKRGWERSKSFRWIGDVTVSGVISMCVSAVIVVTWLVTRHWFPTDILAVCIAGTAIAFVRLPSLRVAFVIMTLFLLYDVFWVYISQYIFKKNVMVTVAQKVVAPSLPMLIGLPRVLDGGISMLGVGDMVLPGLFLSFLYRFDRHCELPFKNGFFLKAWIGYLVGIIGTLFAVVLMNRGQPALLFLVPCTLLPTIAFAHLSGRLGQMWVGPPTSFTLENSDSNSTNSDKEVGEVGDVDGDGDEDMMDISDSSAKYEQRGLLRGAASVV